MAEREVLKFPIGMRDAPAARRAPAARLAAIPRPVRPRPPLGQILVDRGDVAPGDMLKAVAMRAREEARLGDILLAHGWVGETALAQALAAQWGTSAIDLGRDPPDPRLIDRIGPVACLREGLAPWRRIGGDVIVASARPDEFDRHRPWLEEAFGPCRMAIASEQGVRDTLLARRQTALIRNAETCVDAGESARPNGAPRRWTPARRTAAALILFAGVALCLAPRAAFMTLYFWALATLIATTGLKALAALAEIRATTRLRGAADLRGLPAPPRARPMRLPTISLLVPLFHERDVAARLVAHLGRLEYPRELLDALLIVEEEDVETRAALEAAALPRWMRIVVVPDGPLRTKPRALNFALNFCRGSIIGVYDAEDRPDPDQLHIVARRFAEAAPEVVCLQGALDYYNPRTNWLARCFTIEYAVWFRAFLPGLARLGLVVPLGGTTLFFRRGPLESLGAWDAWNVTEDCDLGLRLARRGLRTELIPTATQEEANCRPLPWIRQRSRWLKGFAVTWAVHMRDPAALLRDLGWRRFLAVQILLVGTLSQYLLAPLLWTSWIMIFGLPHPIGSVLSGGPLIGLIALFVLSEVTSIAVAAWATRGADHRHLIPWTPTMHVYFPLGAAAAWKALWEMTSRPFFWDKTTHGLFQPAEDLPPDNQRPAAAQGPG